MTPLLPVLARYERFVYSKKKIALYKKATGFRVWTRKKNLLLHEHCIWGALKGKWGG